MGEPSEGIYPRRKLGLLARVGLVVAGISIMLASGALLAVLAVWTILTDSWGWGLVGVAALLACGTAGFRCLRRGLPSSGRGNATRPMTPREVVVTLVGAAILVALLALGARDAGGLEGIVLRRGRMHPAFGGWVALLAVLLTPVVILIHELGHVVAGALVGLRFRSVQVGPIAVVREPDGVLRLRRGPALPEDVLGLQSSVLDGRDALALRLAVHGAGGPALNLATAGVAWGVASVLGSPQGAAGTVFLDVARIGAVLSAAIGLWNLIPRRTRSGQWTDGARILQFLRVRTPAATALLLLWGRHAQAHRPRAWAADARELVRLAEAEPASRDGLLLFALGIALDEGDQALAREILGRAVAIVDPTIRLEVSLQAALLAALDGSPRAARQHLEAAGRHPTLGDYTALAEAAVFLAEERAEEADAALRRWERLVAGGPASVRVGNEWAEEALRARLAGGRAPVAVSSSSA